MAVRKYRIAFEEPFCKGCGICVKFCPAKVLELTGNAKIRVVNEENCIGCKACENRCPDYAISVEVKENEAQG